jgi:hypothetical protein
VRVDIQSERKLRQVNMTPMRAGAAGSEADRPPSSAATPSRSTRRGAAAQPPPGPPSEVIPPSSASDNAPHLVIWGTDVSVQVCKQKFKTFLTTFVDATIEDDEKVDGFVRNKPLYMQRLDEVSSSLT